MKDETQRLFEFAPYLEDRESTLALVKRFAQADAYRSAVVEELELDEDFHRRPLRPEDLEFLQFRRPVTARTVSRLPALAANRLLLSINELDVARFPKDGDAAAWRKFQAFHDPQMRVLGARIRPFLENFAFDYLAAPLPSQGDPAARCRARLARLAGEESRFWDDMLAHIAERRYLQPGLSFIAIQRWSLEPARITALDRAAAMGVFDALPPDGIPGWVPSDRQQGVMTTLADLCGVNRAAHTYWQFYLPTSLAKCNLLYALASGPERALAAYGAAFAAETEAAALAAAIETACPHLAAASARGQDSAGAALLDTQDRCDRALAAVRHKFGQAGLVQFESGMIAWDIAAAAARWDMGEQLRWLSAIDDYCDYAHRIDERIQRECPEIDRETFVEPREMCSTTHVHNDHRLVVIESGDMVFWGNVGMRLNMTVGDMVLIPDGRLHGSTVVSPECTYHQPIIPDEWMAELRIGTAPVPVLELATCREEP
jgi:hypothetical protein